MPRLSFKPDASFFRKIVIGAVGARAVAADLGQLGHHCAELERGATDTKLWKDVKRKRVRIPDLVCLNCGQRVECRAKTKLELAMSHSPTDAERAWDFGMVDADWVAFPVCAAVDESDWTSGSLSGAVSYWREKNCVRWATGGRINYFSVAAFRSTVHARSRRKGAEEAAENVIAWDATFARRSGVVEAVDPAQSRVTVRGASNGRRQTWRVRDDKRVVVSVGQRIEPNEVIAAAVPPVSRHDLRCSGTLTADHVSSLLVSRERTQRFTGVKLARLRRDAQHAESIRSLADDPEEDIYVRLEATSYLASVAGESAGLLFRPLLENQDEQGQLETVIALGEASTDETVESLCGILSDASRPYFLRSAAAWSLGQTRSEAAGRRLVEAFSDMDHALRADALEGLAAIGSGAIPALLRGLRDADQAVGAGCAEVLRRSQPPSRQVVDDLLQELRSPEPQRWAVWLVGQLPREQFAAAIANLQDGKPELHYAISLLWSFVESWISRRWELRPTANLMEHALT